MLTLDVPYAHLNSDLLVLLAVRSNVLPREPALDSRCRKKLWEVCSRCWMYSPESRITVHEVICELKFSRAVSISMTPQDATDAINSTDARNDCEEVTNDLQSAKGMFIYEFISPCEH